MNFNFDLSSNLSQNASYFSGFGISTLPASPEQVKRPFSFFTSIISNLQACQEREDLFFSDDEENDPKPRLPLFGRCPLTNRAYLDHTPPSRKPLKSASSPYSPAKSPYSPFSPTKNTYSPYSLYSPSKMFSPTKAGMSPYYREEKLVGQETDLYGRSRLLMDVNSRMPLLQISNNRQNYERNSPKKISWSQVARKSAPNPEDLRTPPGFNVGQAEVAHVRNVSTNLFPALTPEERKKAAAVLQAKPSLDDVQDDSAVAMTNKHGKGKYWFKSGCPTPDPRWPARQQLMIGPIPGDVEYATLRSMPTHNFPILLVLLLNHHLFSCFCSFFILFLTFFLLYLSMISNPTLAQVGLPLQGPHHPPVHPEQPGLAGEEPGEVRQEAGQVRLRGLHGARGGPQTPQPRPRHGGSH